MNPMQSKMRKIRETWLSALPMRLLTTFLLLSAVFLVAAPSTTEAITIEKQIGPFYGTTTAATTTNTSYTDLDANYNIYVQWDGTKYTSPTVYFESVIKTTNATATAYAALYDTANNYVTGSEITTSSTSYVRIRSSAISLTNGTDYKVRIKSSTSSYSAQVLASRLVIVQNATSISATETYIHLNAYSTTTAISATTPTYTQGYYYDSSNFDGTVTVYFEATLKTSNASYTAYARLYNNTDSAAVASSQVSTTSTTLTRVRSGAITLTSGKEYVLQHWMSSASGTNTTSSGKIIIQQSGAITRTESHALFVIGGSGWGNTSATYVDSTMYNYFDPSNWSGVYNTYYHQVHSSSDASGVLMTQLYNFTDGTELDARQCNTAGSTTFIRLGLSSPLEMPTAAKTLTAQQKRLITSGGFAANRLIIQTKFSSKVKLAKQVHIQGIEKQLKTNNAEAQIDYYSGPFTAIPFYWDPTKYTSPRVYFEAVLKTSDTTKFAAAALHNKSSGAVVTGSRVYTISSTHERVRSGAITLTSGVEYEVRVTMSATGANMTLNNSRLIIYQEGDSFQNTESHAFLAGYNTIAAASYAEVTDPMRYYYDSSQFDGTVTVYFEAGLKTSAGTAYAQLYDITAAAAVAGSEVTSTNTGTTFERKRSSAVTLTTDHEYRVQIKNSATNTTTLGGAKLVIQQTSGTELSTTESYYQLTFSGYKNDSGTHTNTYTAVSYTDTNVLNAFERHLISDPSATYYHEATFKISTGTGYVRLQNKTDSSTIDDRTTTGATYTRLSSSTLTMPTSTKTLETQVNTSSGGTLTVGGNRWIAQTSLIAPSDMSLQNHAAGQEADKFDGVTSVTNEELFAFRLKNNTVSTIAVTQIEFPLSSVTGIVQGDFANLVLCVDDDGDGTIEAGETTTVGGSGSVDVGVTKITFSTSFNVNAGATVNYILKGDVSNLAINDAVTIGLGASNLTLSSGTISGTVSSVAHTANGTLTLADHSSGQVGDAFGTSTPVTDVLYRFKLSQALSTEINTLRVNFTTAGGVANGDVTSCELWQDNGDGVYQGAGTDTLIEGTVTPVGGVITFNTNFTPGTGGTVYFVRATVSNLVPTDTTTFSMGTGDIDPTAAGVTESGSVTNATHTADGTLTLANHDSGQVGDALGTSTPVTDVFFRFKLTRAGDFQVDNLRVNYTIVGGIVDADVTAGAIYVDVNNNGTYEAGTDTAVQTGIAGSGGKLTFTTDFTPATGGTHYLVRATIANLVPGDTTTFSVGTTDIDTTYSGGVTKSGSISNATHTADGTLTLADHGSTQVTDKFTFTTPVTDVLFRFKLSLAGAFQVDALRVNYTEVPPLSRE